MDKKSDKKSVKKVLITGCSSGFGLLTAVEAAKAGFEVVATMRNLQKQSALEQALGAAGVSAVIDELDVVEPSQIEAVAARHKPIDILINNAGVLIGGSFLDITDDEVKTIFETNYFGAVNLAKTVAADMIERKSGLIINVASLAGRVGHMFNAAYSASKHALVGFSRSVRTELKPFGVKVVSVEPGYHRTEIIRNNANLSENFLNRNSPMYQYNRGFLRLMMKEVRPRAGEPRAVARQLVKIMQAKRPKGHYIVGKDAVFATTLQWLGLIGLFEKLAYDKLLRNMQREAKRKSKTPK